MAIQMKNGSQNAVRIIRPYLSPSAIGAFGAVIIACVGMELGWRSFANQESSAAALITFSVVSIIVIIPILVFLVVSTHRSHLHFKRHAIWFMAGVIIAFLGTSHAIMKRDYMRTCIAEQPISTYWIVPSPDGSISAYGYRTQADVLDASRCFIGTVELMLDEVPPQNVILQMVGRFTLLRSNDWDRSCYIAGSVGGVKGICILENVPKDLSLIECARQAILETIDPDSAPSRALLAGIICGRTTELKQTDAQNSFALTGTSHLIAVSGSHLALVSALLLALFERLHIRQGIRVGVLIVVMSGYTVFTGGAASAVRSLIMVVVSMVTGLGGRRAHALSGLSLTIIVLVAYNPGVVYDVGFQLSVMSVLFLLLFARYIATRFSQLGIPNMFAEPLSLTLVAQWATLPITISLFNQISLVAPLANVVLGPLMGAVMLVGFIMVPLTTILEHILLVLLFGPHTLALGQLLLLPVDVLSSLSVFLAAFFAEFPFASLAVDGEMLGTIAAFIAYGSSVALYLLWNNIPSYVLIGVPFCLIVACAVPIIRGTWFASPEIRVMDVGQGDAILVRDGAASLLVDCGVDDACAQALARAGIIQLDGLVITHWDKDHWGGLEYVLEGVNIDTIYVVAGAVDAVPKDAQALTLPPISEVSWEDTLVVGGFRCKVIWPKTEVKGEDNKDSCVLDVRYELPHDHEFSILLTGDSEKDSAEQYMEQVGDIDVFKLGHHGSKASLSPDMMKTLSPDLVVASAGANNRYGHPSQEIISIVEDYDATFLCTITSGDIVLDPHDATFAS